MNFSRKRILAIVLTIAMLLSQSSVAAYAENQSSEENAIIDLEVEENNDDMHPEDVTDEGSEDSGTKTSDSEEDSVEIIKNENNSDDTSSSDDISEDQSQQTTEQESAQDESESAEGSCQAENETEQPDESEENEDDEFNNFANSFGEDLDETQLEEAIDIGESKSLNASNSNYTEWYKDYKYELDDSKKTITLKSFKGSGDVYVYNHAVIGGKRYSTCFDGEVFHYDHGSEYVGSRRDINSVTFEEGCKTVGNHLSFGALKTVKKIDLSGLDTSSITDMSNAFCCNELQELNLSNVNTSNVTTMACMFISCGITTLDISGLDTSNVQDMHHMFANCNNLVDIKFGSLDTSNVTRMDSMFSNCEAMRIIDLRCFNTSKATCMDGMFMNCKKLESVDVSSFDTRRVTRMDSMFSGCKSLKSIDVSNFDTSNVTNFMSMFLDCVSLKSIDVRGFNTSKCGTFYTSMFGYCDSLRYLDLSSFECVNEDKDYGIILLVGHCIALEELISPQKLSGKVPLPSEYILDNDGDGQSDDGKVYKEIPKDYSKARFIKKGSKVVPRKSGFDLTMNGHAVVNASYSFGYGSGYAIPLARYSEVFGDSYIPFMGEVSRRVWGGNCFGMSLTAAMFYKNMLPLNSYVNKNGSNLTTTGYDSIVNPSGNSYLYLNKDSEMTKLIERYHIWQYSKQSYEEGYRDISKFDTATERAKEFSNIIAEIKNSKEPFYFSVYYGAGGHTMVVDSSRTPKTLDNGWVEIYIYDPNHPYMGIEGVYNPLSPYASAKNRSVFVNTKNGQWHMSVMLNADGTSANEIGSAYNDMIFFQRIDSVPVNFNKKAVYKATDNSTNIAYDSSDFTVYNSSGKMIYKRDNGAVTYYDIGYVTDIRDCNNAVDISGISCSRRLILTEGNYKVIVDDGSVEFLEGDDYIGVLTSNNPVIVENKGSNSLSLKSENPGKALVVVKDENAGAGYTAIETNLNTNDEACVVSLEGNKLNVISENEQSLDIKVKTNSSAGDINGISTKNLKNYDVTSILPKSNLGSETAISDTNDTASKADIVISQDKTKISASKLKKKAQKVTISVENTDGKITAKNASSKKLKKYLKVSVSNGKVICKLKKGARKGTYKVKVMVSGDSSHGDITKTIKIKVK